MDLSKVRSAVKMARKFNVPDREILDILLKNEYGGVHRREIVVEWGNAVGLDETTALRFATEMSLIPSAHSPRTWKPKETLPSRGEGKTPE